MKLTEKEKTEIADLSFGICRKEVKFLRKECLFFKLVSMFLFLLLFVVVLWC